MGPQAAWYVSQIGKLLGAISEADLNRMMNVMVERRVHAHELLFTAGDRTDAIYILVQGRVKLFSVADNGKEVILDLLQAGDIVGETALVENGIRQISAEALEETIAVGLSRGDFEALMQVRPTLAAAVAHILARQPLAGLKPMLAGAESCA
jgi:CRP/FNR family transcriptional regulator, cyclic AMP receptor protein